MKTGFVLRGKGSEVGMSERPEKRKVEFIESYWTGGELGSDYQWNDNHGELIRCKDCKHGCRMGYSEVYICESPEQKNKICIHVHKPEWFCADGERKYDDD